MQLRRQSMQNADHGLPFSVVVTSIVRMSALNPASKSSDTTYGTLKSTIWTTIEANVGIWCACGPTLRGPFAALFPRIFSRSSGADSEWPPSGNRALVSIGGFVRQKAALPKQDTSGHSGSESKPERKLPYAGSEMTRASTRTFGSQDAIMSFGKDDDGTISVPLNTMSKKMAVDIELGDDQRLAAAATSAGKVLAPR